MCSFKSSPHPWWISSISGIAQHRTCKLKIKIQTTQSAGKGNPWIFILVKDLQLPCTIKMLLGQELTQRIGWILVLDWWVLSYPIPIPGQGHIPMLRLLWGCSALLGHFGKFRFQNLNQGFAQPSWTKAEELRIWPGTWAGEISTLTFG